MAEPVIQHRELDRLIAKRFLQRRDVKALQSPSGAYRPIRTAWKLIDIDRHVNGQVSYGHYLLDADNLTRVCAFDLDFDDEVTFEDKVINAREVFTEPRHPAKKYLNAQIRGLGDGLAHRLQRKFPQLTVMATFSGSKGLHILGSFPEPTTGTASRAVAVSILESFGCFKRHKGKNFWVHALGEYPGIKIETFPKQTSIGNGGFGNLLRVPLGINQKTGAQGFFYNLEAPLESLEPDDPILALTKGSIR